MRLENGGKARALNQGLAFAKSDLVVALDADTQFEPDTIGRLARWLRRRLACRRRRQRQGRQPGEHRHLWQALEYVTAQNVERRALAWLGGDDRR